MSSLARDGCTLAAAILAASLAGHAAHAEPEAVGDADAEPNAAGEVIEVTGAPPAQPGAIALDAHVARQTAGALGEPFRVLSLLPGVVTSIAASGYPVIRGTLPGESRFEFDGIELPALYHFLIGNQMIHPSFIADVTLRAGGHGAEAGHLLGGLVALTAASASTRRTELRANPVEIGAYHAQPLSPSTDLAVAARVGTLTVTAKLYDPRATLYSVDQQARLVHRLAGGDQLTLTSLAAYDHARLPPSAVRPDLVETDKLGFHRLDGRWSRVRPGYRARAGVETAIDSLRRSGVNSPSHEQGGRSYGVRAYADGSVDVVPRLTVRGGLYARRRSLVNSASPFALSASDPFLGLARTVDAQGAWTALDLRLGRVQIAPGARIDRYHSELYGASARHVTIDPRLAIAAELHGARAELAVGAYSAPPQLSLQEPATVIGPLPMTDGTASLAGMNRATAAQLSLVAPLGAGLQGSFAAYVRDTRYAIDFGLAGASFRGGLCGEPPVIAYRNIEARALGVEAMIRRDLGHAVTGWLSYSLGKSERDLGFAWLPGDFDQRHTLNATAQWQSGSWRFGASGHLHTGRPLPYRQIATCSTGDVSIATLPLLARRPPLSWRIDLRAERAFEVSGAQLRVYAELQNATFAREVLSYDADIDLNDPGDLFTFRGTPNTLLIPLPILGVEAVL